MSKKSKSIACLILVISLICMLASNGLAQKPESLPEGNLENPESENKKDTVIFQERKSEIFQPIDKEEGLTPLQREARLHRNEGIKLQGVGQIDEAMSCYQKAIELDPSYVEPYNDLGVVYEMMGFKDAALEMYLKALEIGPNYLPTYSNLAAFYEERGDLKTAADYLKKRVRFGSPDDRWTQKAQERLENIGLIVEDVARGLKEEEIIDLIKEVTLNKAQLRSVLKAKTDEKKQKVEKTVERKQKDERKQKAKKYLISARVKLQRGNLLGALDDAAIAKHLDPSNIQIDNFIEEVHNKLKDTYSH